MSEKTYDNLSAEEKELVEYLRANFKNRNALAKYKSGLYQGLLIYYPHILNESFPKYTFAKVKADALKYKILKDWYTNSRRMYYIAHRNKWIKQCTKHMERKNKIWTMEELINDSKKYKSRNEWKKKSPKSYDAATRKGLYKFTNCPSQRGRWAKDKLLKSAKKYKTQTEWKKNTYSGIVKYAKKHGWLEECCTHMIKQTKMIVNLDTKIIYKSIGLASSSLKINKSNIVQAAKKNKTAGGYRWAYCDEKGNVIKD